MKQSTLFYKSLKESPKDAQAKSHILLTRAGFIDQSAAGVFTFLPLGLRVLKNIERIIREEMIKVDGQEILMPALISKESWEKTGRWESFDVLFKLKGSGDKEYGLGATHEEVISPLAKKIILSYKDLPLCLFQIQTKFRDELRVKSGLLRTREFLMKDLYSFHTDEEDLGEYYEKVSKAYLNIFKRCGIKAYKTLASGGSFSKFSHEYQMVTEAGEDTIYVCSQCDIAINKEIKDKVKKCPQCGGSKFEEKKAVEVGNIFNLGDKYSLPFDLKFKDKDGKEKPVIMGCYGIGLSRLMAAIVEANNDERGIIWPKEVAPFDIHLISIKAKKEADKLYNKLKDKRVLYDDREDVGAGEKFADADLMGIPERWVISSKTLEKKSIEIKKRNSQKPKIVKIDSY